MSRAAAFRTLAVVGAGTMGSGIAQKMATEGFALVLVDVDDAKVAAGVERIRQTLDEGVARRIFKREQASEILGRIRGTSDWQALAETDLVVEAVFEDERVKKRVIERLEQVCRPDAILATNTSSFAVTDLARNMRHPGRLVGLHYFYHPAKNRLVEVVPGAHTDAHVLQRAWQLQEQLGKVPIASSDSYGFIVNRYFAVWLNEAVRLVERGAADIATVEAAAKEFFGIGMGPFELMNVTGIPIAMHTCDTLGRAFGPFYAPAELLTRQVAASGVWDLHGAADPTRAARVADHMLGAVIYVAAKLVEEEVGSIDDVDIGARVGLRWPQGPFELANRVGVARAHDLAAEAVEPWRLTLPRTLEAHARSAQPFEFTLVRSRIDDGIATLTINRPDTLNAINEDVVAQLEARFRAAAGDPSVRGIVIAGSGKAFIAGADIRFFIANIENATLARTVEFTQRCQNLLREIDECSKPVVARMHGLALGGGLELALACDHIVASDKAAMAFPETGIGIYPGLGGTQRTTRRVGVGLAKYLVLTGQMLRASEAAAIGLVDRVVAPAHLDTAVREALARGVVTAREAAAVPASHARLAEYFEHANAAALLDGSAANSDDPAVQRARERVAAKAPIAVCIASDLIEQGARLPLAAALPLELEHLTEIFGTRDALAGLKSIGGPPPRFEGR